MGFMDAFNAEDRITVKVTNFGSLVKEAAKAELIMNAVKCDVPHIYIREMMTGEMEDLPAIRLDTMLEEIAKAPVTLVPDDPEPVKYSKPAAESLVKEVEVEVKKEDKPAKATIKSRKGVDVETIQRMAKEGASITAIMNETGSTYATVKKYMEMTDNGEAETA